MCTKKATLITSICEWRSRTMSPVTFEYYPKMSEQQLADAQGTIKKNCEHWDDPFFQNPRDHVNLGEVREVCDKFLAKHPIENVAVCGTGGSIQTMLALAPLAKKKCIPLWSSRATELKAALIGYAREKTCVIPISRGGKTLDINSVIAEFTEYPVIALASRGPMYDLVKGFDCPIMDVPDLAGRFAGATNVGIVPAYLCGIDVEEFLTGLESGYAQFSLARDPKENAALQFACFLFHLYNKGFRNVFNAPYTQWLEGSVGLFVQQISESSGKEDKGLLGTSQPAPIFQHSVLELLLGGSKGHTIPVLWNLKEDPDDFRLDSPLEDVRRRTAHEIISYQADATFEAILKVGLPAAKVTLERPTIKQVGELVAFIQNAVYFTCMLFNVNWANNPLVLTGKEICNEALAKNLGPEEREANRKSVATAKFEQFW